MREPENSNYKPISQSFLNLELKPIKEGIEHIPNIITFPAYPSIKASEKEIHTFGEVATNALRKFATKDEANTTYGIYDKDGKFYIGNKLAIIVDNDLVVGRDEYEGTPGLWELIMLKTQTQKILLKRIMRIMRNKW